MNTATADLATSLGELLQRSASREAIADTLDGMSPIDRVDTALSLHGAQVGQLYKAVAGGPITRVEDFVPNDTPARTTIIFEGRNSLPMFSSFQKRFARLESGQVVGYNHQTMSFATGPGYFVVKEASEHADVPGEAYFDYTDVPQDFPNGWPAYKPNAHGVGHLVYKNMKDYMRRVATNVYVGAAFKVGKKLGAYFILTHA